VTPATGGPPSPDESQALAHLGDKRQRERVPKGSQGKRQPGEQVVVGVHARSISGLAAFLLGGLLLR
jgi:hypothetical protein